MKKTIYAACAVAFTVLGVNQSAIAGAGDHNIAVVQLHNNVSIAGGASYQNQSRFLGKRFTQDGWLPSIKASASYMSPAHYLLSAGIQYSFGKQDLNDVNQTIENDIVSVHLRIGKGFLVSNHFLVTPFVTYGHRYWNRESDAKLSNLTLEYNTNYLGAGIMFDYQATPRLVLSAEALAGGTFANTFDLQLSVWGNSNSTDADLGSGLIAKAAMKADYRFYANWHIFGVANITYLDHGDLEYRGTEVFDAGDLYNISLNAGIRYTY